LKSSDAIIDAVRRENLKLMVGHIERFNHASRRVGPFSSRIRDVGIIIDLAVHDIDAISYLYGKRALNVYSIAGTPHKIRKLQLRQQEEWHMQIIWSRALGYGNKM